MYIKKRLILIFVIFAISSSCRFDFVEELTSSYAINKSITVNLDFPDGCYAYGLVYTNLNSTTYTYIESGDTLYSSDSGVIVKAISTYGYIFDKWLGPDVADRTTNSTAVLLDTNKTITAVFIVDPKPTKITVRTRVAEGGIIDFGIVMSEIYYKGDTYYSGVFVGSDILINAIADNGYKFSHWVGDDIKEKTLSETYFKAPNHSTTIEAVFEKIEDNDNNSDNDIVSIEKN